MSTVFPSGLGNLGCSHIPEAWAGLFPKDGLSWGWRSWGGCASQWALPHDPDEPVPLCCNPQPPVPGGSSCSETTPPAPRGCAASGLEELWKAPWAPCLLVLGFPPSAFFLRVAPPMDESTLPRVVLQELGFVQGTGWRRNGTQALSASSGTFHSDNPGTGLYPRLWFLREKAMATHSSPLAWKIPWMEEPGRLQSMGSLRVGQDWATSLSLFTFIHWRRK